MNLVNLCDHKQNLTREYENLSRNDLLWLLAIVTPQRATFSGALQEYLQTYRSKNAEVQRIIADAGSGDRAMKKLRFQYFGVAGGSGATLYTATINGIPVMLKRTIFDIDIPEGTKIGVIYETLLVKHFFSYMLDNNITPNLPFYYGSRIEEHEDISISYLYTEFMDGKELDEQLQHLAKDGLIAVKFWRSILFQLLYTVLCFQELHIRHNDLRIINIFIDPDIRGEIKYYTSEDTYYLVPLGGVGLVKIFDMDMASVDCTKTLLPHTKSMYSAFRSELNKQFQTNYEHCDNTKLGAFFQEFGVQPRGTTLFDVFVLFCNILLGFAEGDPGYEAQVDGETRAFINRVFSDSELKTKYAFHCYSEKVNKEAKSYKSLPSILNDEYFLPLRNVPSDTPNIYHLPSVRIE